MTLPPAAGLSAVPGDAAREDAAYAPDAPLPVVPEMDVPAATDDPPRQLALLYADLPETERSALILFYLFLFDPAELAELLEIKPAELGPLLLRGRTLLQRHGNLCDQIFAAFAPLASGDAPTDPDGVRAPAETPVQAVPDAA